MIGARLLVWTGHISKNNNEGHFYRHKTDTNSESYV